MTPPSFRIEAVVPCADYEGFTMEGEITWISLDQIYDDVRQTQAKVTYLKAAHILILKLRHSEIYFYGSGKFIISRIESEESGIQVIKNIVEGRYHEQARIS